MKVKRVFLAPELITEMLTIGSVLRGEIEVTAGVPAGAVLVAIGWDAGRFCYALDFFHNDFEPVADGQLPPDLDIRFTRRVLVVDLSVTA